jgi:hypothetical protein
MFEPEPPTQDRPPPGAPGLAPKFLRPPATRFPCAPRLLPALTPFTWAWLASTRAVGPSASGG